MDIATWKAAVCGRICCKCIRYDIIASDPTLYRPSLRTKLLYFNQQVSTKCSIRCLRYFRIMEMHENKCYNLRLGTKSSTGKPFASVLVDRSHTVVGLENVRKDGTAMPPPLPLHPRRRAGQQHHRVGPAPGSTTTTGRSGAPVLTSGIPTASAPRTSSPTPTPCSTTPCTATTTASTCSASSPACPLYHDFDTWAKMGRELLELHLGFETADPYPLERVDSIPAHPEPVEGHGPSHPAHPEPVEGHGPSHPAHPEPVEGRPPRAILRADLDRGVITLDEQTTLTGVPADAWRYQLGSRSALEWVLDQYKERKPRDPTIRERFNTYRFADHKERVIDLLRRVCTGQRQDDGRGGRHGLLGRRPPDSLRRPRQDTNGRPWPLKPLTPTTTNRMMILSTRHGWPRCPTFEEHID